MVFKKNNKIIIDIFLISLKNIFEPKVFKWVIWTIILTTICLSILSYGIFILVKSFISVDIPFIGDYIDSFLIYGAIFIMIWGSTILFVPLSTMVFAIFQEKVINEIEIKYYPETIKKLEPKIATFLIAGIKLLGWTILIQVFLFPFAIFFGGAFWWIPLTIIINGFLISKEYFEAIGLRKLDHFKVKIIKNQLLWPSWLYGILSAILFLIPILNLLVPALLTLLMLHLFNKNFYKGPIPD